MKPLTAIYPNSRRATIHTRYFTRTKITHRTLPPATEHWHDLDDLYAV